MIKTPLLATCLFLLCVACQRGGNALAIRVTFPSVPTQTPDATPTYNIITLVAHTFISAETQAQVQTENPPIASLTAETTGELAGDRPLIIPRILQADYTPRATRLVIGFDIDPAFRGKPEVFGEIYDAKLTDQVGREIAGISMERTEPEKSTLEFAPLPSGVSSLTLRAQLALRGVPAAAPLAIDVSGHPLDQPWPIQKQVRFGDVGVKLHTARLLLEEIGRPPDAKQQVSLELYGENAELNGAQLICIFLSPLPPPVESSVSCGQEPGGIQATVSLGVPVDRSAALPMPAGLVLLEAAGDFLLPGYWETTFPVKK